MARPIIKSLLFHGIAFCIGLGGAACFSTPAVTTSASLAEAKPAQTQRQDRSADSTRLSSPSSFRSAYFALINRPMTKSERSNCMEMLWAQWSASDPDGMLAFLEKKRVWPEGHAILSNLSERPDLLFRLALRYGTSDAIQYLNYSDPIAVARLLEALPEEQKGEELIMLAKLTDRKLGELGIVVEEPSPAYRRGVAESLLETGQIEEFFNAFREVGDPEEMRELAKEWGEALSYEKPGDKVFAQLLRLPEEYRKEAASNLIPSENAFEMKFPEVREEHRRWLEKLAAEGFVEAAAMGVDDLFADESTPNRGEEIAAWVARFPTDGSWKPIADEIFRTWRDIDRDGMIPQICALPNGPIREYMATEAAMTTIGGLAQPYDEEDKLVYDRLSKLFTNPQAREQFEKKVSPLDPFAPEQDPFAAETDPFAPAEDPFAEKQE